MPHNPAKWTAFVIFNNSEVTFSYQLALSGRLTSSVDIEAGKFDYVLEYDQVNEDTLDSQLSEVIIQENDCKIKIKRPELLSMIRKDPDGRNTWNLYINKGFLEEKCQY